MLSLVGKNSTSKVFGNLAKAIKIFLFIAEMKLAYSVGQTIQLP